MNKIVNKIKYEIVSFLNTKKRTEISTRIEIDKDFKELLIKKFKINEFRFKQSNELIDSLKLKNFLNHIVDNDTTLEINRVEFKLIKQKNKTIQKRIRSLTIKSPLYLSIRMIKTRK